MNAIEVKGLEKRFGSFQAVRGITFAVDKGEIFGFLGPNGAGKSTTINILTTLLQKSSGEAVVAGANVGENPEKVRERICLISQEGSVDGDLTALENLEFYARLYGVPKSEIGARAKKALEFVSLYDKKDVSVKFFSGGMKRRLEISKVFMSEPEIIFLDEPTIGLDPQSREMIWTKIFEINRVHKTTIFLTTHYMQEAESLCNRIAIVDKGRIVAIGTPEKLREGIGVKEIVELASNKEAVLAKHLEKAGFGVEPLSSGRLRVVSRTQGTLDRIKKISAKNGTVLKNASVRPPSMEDVFLHYTGRDVRDEKADGLGLTRLIARRSKS